MRTWYPFSFKCSPSYKNSLNFLSSLPAASNNTVQISITGTPSLVPTLFTASAYSCVVSNWRSRSLGGSLEARSAPRWWVFTGGGVIRMILVSEEYQAEAGEVTIRTICLRLEVNSGRGTCWTEGGMQASLAPNQMVRIRTLGTCCCSCWRAKSY